MRWPWWVLAIAGCNRVFGLVPTQLPPPDAPFACPAPGGVPTFSSILHQSVLQFCDYLTVSEDTQMAMAECFEPRSFIGFGAKDGELVPVPEAQISSQLRYPRLAPEGDRAFVYQGTPPAIEIFALANGTWTAAGAIALPSSAVFSDPTRPPRHLLYVLGVGSTQVIHEIVETAGAWNEIDRYAISTLGMDDISSISLSPDGLRLVLYGTRTGVLDYQVLYADRPSMDARFGTATPIDRAPPVYDAFLSGDCSRLYFSSNDLQQVLFLQQQ